MNIVSKSIIRLIREVYRVKLSKLNKNRSFTIIAQNCIGGVIYNDLKLPFTSPTINMFIEDLNFIKLVENLEHYMSIRPVPITDNYIDPIDNSIHYPKIRIDDIEVCCLHYKSCAEAIDSWIRRAKRVNFDNVYVIGNSWNMHQNEELIRRLCQNDKYKTICVTYGNFDIPNCVQLPGDYWALDNRGIVRPNITDYMPHSYKKYFEKFFDFVGWLNT